MVPKEIKYNTSGKLTFRFVYLFYINLSVESTIIDIYIFVFFFFFCKFYFIYLRCNCTRTKYALSFRSHPIQICSTETQGEVG